MEVLVPLITLGSLYVISNQRKTKKEHFTSNTNALPNTNIPNRNYPSEYPIVSGDTDQTSALSHDNRYDGKTVYTDKFFNPNSGISVLDNPDTPMRNSKTNDVTKYASLTGQQVDSTYFQHNNMVPFFGGSLRTRHVSDNSNESVLDNYNGSGSQAISKKEQAPLFSPHANLQYAYGVPNQSDFIQSRMNVSTKMNNVKPFGEIKVAPGLGLGAGSEGLGGYNSGMLDRENWIDKSVDELRVNNKPKASGLIALGREGPANHFIKSQGALGKQEKNRPETTAALGADRWFTTTGAEKGYTLVPMQTENMTTRNDTTSAYSGGAGSSVSSDYISGEYMPTHNHALGSVPLPVPDRAGQGIATQNDYSMMGQMSYMNNRSANSQKGYFGSAGGGAITEIIAPILDILRPSRKENSIGTMRPYQNAKPSVTQSYIFDPNDKPLTTIKETTINSKFHLHVNANQRGGGYESTEYQPIENQRDTTSNFSYIGNSSASDRAKQPMSYVADYNQYNNEIKSSVIQNSGRMQQGNMSLLQTDMNQRNNSIKQEQFQNNRSAAPNLPYNIGVDSSSLGSVRQPQGLYSNQQLDRNNGDVLGQLRDNPFAQNILSGAIR